MSDRPESKAEARKSCRARRRELHGGAGFEDGAALARNTLAAVSPRAIARVAGYWPMGDEIDVRPLLKAFHRRGHGLALPVVVGRDEPLVFRDWAPGDTLEPASFGTSVPGADRPEVVPDLVIVPLLAFDGAGYRLGYGGGYYDRSLAVLRAGRVLAVGVAYESQRIARVPREAHDQPLDWVITETGALNISGAAEKPGEPER